MNVDNILFKYNELNNIVITYPQENTVKFGLLYHIFKQLKNKLWQQ